MQGKGSIDWEIQSQPACRDLFSLVGMLRTLRPGDNISVDLRKLLKVAVGEVRLYASLQQREQVVWTSKVRCQVKEFSILCLGRCKPLGSLNSLLSNAPQLSGANPFSLFTFLLALLSCSVVSNSVWPMDHSLPGSSVPGILQVRILEWVSVAFSRGSFQPRDRIQVSCIAGGFFTTWDTRKLENFINQTQMITFFRRNKW